MSNEEYTPGRIEYTFIRLARRLDTNAESDLPFSESALVPANKAIKGQHERVIYQGSSEQLAHHVELGTQDIQNTVTAAQLALHINDIALGSVAANRLHGYVEIARDQRIGNINTVFFSSLNIHRSLYNAVGRFVYRHPHPAVITDWNYNNSVIKNKREFEDVEGEYAVLRNGIHSVIRTGIFKGEVNHQFDPLALIPIQHFSHQISSSGNDQK